jgi:hypothetical protein
LQGKIGHSNEVYELQEELRSEKQKSHELKMRLADVERESLNNHSKVVELTQRVKIMQGVIDARVMTNLPPEVE